MNQHRTVIGIGVALAALLFSLAFAVPGNGQGQGNGGGKPDGDVRVINTPAEPVPVSVQAPVQIDGIPSVHVANAANSPVPICDVKNPAFQPWHQNLGLDLVEGETSAQLHLDIPAGKRLVLEHVTTGLTVMPDQTPVVFFWGTNANRAGVVHNILTQNVGPWGNSIQSRWSGSHPMKVYLDSALVRVSRAGGTLGPLFANVSFSGYLVDLP